VLPGVASRRTVMYNHNAAFIDDPHARTGRLEGNPIHCDMIFAARCANLGFVLNVVLGAEKQILHAVAGDCNEAHLAGCDFIKRYCLVEPIPVEIVITTNGGYPLAAADELLGRSDGRITAIPDGISVVVTK